MKKLFVLLFIAVLAACSMNNATMDAELIDSWAGMDGGFAVTYTFSSNQLNRTEGTSPEMRGPASSTETTISFRFTEFYNAGQWWAIDDTMPWYEENDTTWGWNVEGDTLFLIRGSDTLILIRM